MRGEPEEVAGAPEAHPAHRGSDVRPIADERAAEPADGGVVGRGRRTAVGAAPSCCAAKSVLHGSAAQQSRAVHRLDAENGGTEQFGEHPAEERRSCTRRSAARPVELRRVLSTLARSARLDTARTPPMLCAARTACVPGARSQAVQPPGDLGYGPFGVARRTEGVPGLRQIACDVPDDSEGSRPACAAHRPPARRPAARRSPRDPACRRRGCPRPAARIRSDRPEVVLCAVAHHVHVDADHDGDRECHCDPPAAGSARCSRAAPRRFASMRDSRAFGDGGSTRRRGGVGMAVGGGAPRHRQMPAPSSRARSSAIARRRTPMAARERPRSPGPDQDQRAQCHVAARDLQVECFGAAADLARPGAGSSVHSGRSALRRRAAPPPPSGLSAPSTRSANRRRITTTIALLADRQRQRERHEHGGRAPRPCGHSARPRPPGETLNARSADPRTRG